MQNLHFILVLAIIILSISFISSFSGITGFFIFSQKQNVTAIYECTEAGDSGECDLTKIQEVDGEHELLKITKAKEIPNFARINTSHITNLPDGIEIKDVEVCILGFRDKKLGEGDLCYLAIGENSTGNPSYINILPLSTETCLNWSSLPQSTPVCINATDFINSREGPISAAENMLVSFYAFEKSDKNVNFHIDAIWADIDYKDIEAPKYSNIVIPSQIYLPGQEYQFSITFTENIGIDDVILEFNNVNYNPKQDGSVYYHTFKDLPAGNYNYKWFASDASGNHNSTSGVFTISRASRICTLTLSPASPITYGTQTTASCSCTYPEDGTVKLWRNNSDVTAENGTQVTLPAGVWDYVCNITQTQNYTSASDSASYTVNKAGTEINLYLNSSNSDKKYAQWQIADITAVLDVNKNISIYKNNTLFVEGESPLEYLYNCNEIGAYEINAIFSGDENYTSSESRHLLTVQDINIPIINIFLENKTYNTKNISLNYTVSEAAECMYSLSSQENITIPNCTNTTVAVQDGHHNITLYANDSSGNIGFDTVCFSIDTASPVITNISVSVPEITWNTNELADSAVFYGTYPGNYTMSVLNTAYVTNHNITLTNLTQATYYFVIKSIDKSNNLAQSDEYNFTISKTSFCGDDNCDKGEDCSNCPADCGVCPQINAGISSGGGVSGYGSSGGGLLPEQGIKIKSSSTRIEILAPYIKSKTQTFELPETELPITQLSINLNKILRNTNIIIEKAEKVNPNSYQDFDINVNDQTGITEIKIKFKIEKNWLISKSIDPEAVSLNKLKNGRLVKLETKKISGDDKYIYFEAISPGLSRFSITGRAVSSVEECPTCPSPTAWSECVEGKQTRTNYRCSAATNYICEAYTEEQACEVAPSVIPPKVVDWMPLIALIVIILILGILCYKYYKPKPKKCKKR